MRAVYRWFLVLICLTTAFPAVSFVAAPSLSKDGGGNWWIEFEVSQNTDVAVSVVNIKDSSVIRNLAAGMLGTNPPAPLAANNLHQKLAWDHKDNYGRTVTVADSLLRGRVRAGMAPHLDALIGGDPLTFATSMNGFRQGPDGTFYVAAGNISGIEAGYYFDGMIPVRRFDANGNYLCTVFPPRADLTVDSVAAFGVNQWAGGSWSPKTWVLNFASLSTNLLKSQTVGLAPSGAADELFLFNGSSIQTMRISGAALPQDVERTLSPAAGGGNAMGAVFYAMSHDPRYFYLSGKFFGTISTSTWSLETANDTGFWADGQIFKVNKSTGSVSKWLAVTGFPTTAAARLADIGDGQYYSVFHGVDIDDSNHVFVCDRFNRRVSVYDTSKTFLGSIPVRWPDVVSVNRKTGELYVLSRYTTVTRLYKFAGWRGSPAPLCSLVIGTAQYANNNKPTMVVTQNAGKTLLWIGASAGSYGSAMFLKIYQDNGTSFSLFKDVLKPTPAATLIDYNRMAVDRRNETVYIQNCWTGLYKIENWANPVAVICSTSARQPLTVDDMAIDAKRGYLYVREATQYTISNEPINRYTLDHLHAPAPFANSGTNMLTPSVSTGDVQGHPTRGMDVSPVNGTVICNHMTAYGSGQPIVSLYPDMGTSTATLGTALVQPLTAQSGGAKFDLQGNYYIGTKTRSPDHVVPAGYETDNAYTWGVGAIVKYQAGSSGHAIPGDAWYAPTGLPLVKSTTGALKVYAPGFAPFGGGGTMYKGCACRSPRFDVDDYGRLFIPNAVTKQVAVIDNNGNQIMIFGQYGNMDSRGGFSGPGQTIATPAFPLAYPVSAAASEDYIYVGDMNNWRMMRVQMTYTLDNFPGLTNHNASLAGSGSIPVIDGSLSAAPNPFRTGVIVRCALPAGVSAVYRIYNTLGRVVFSSAMKPAGHGIRTQIQWNGRNLLGIREAAGFYIGKLAMSNGKTLTHKLLLLK